MKSISHNTFDCRIQANPLNDVNRSIYNRQKKKLREPQNTFETKQKLSQKRPRQLFDLVEDDQLVNINTQKESSEKESINLCDFVQRDQQQQIENQQKLQTQTFKALEKQTQKGGDILDFIESEDQLPQGVAPVVTTPQQLEQKNMESIEVRPMKCYTVKESTFMRYILPEYNYISFLILIEKDVKNRTTYDLQWFQQSICRCISINNKFVFETNEGPIAQMQRQDNSFLLNQLDQSFEGRRLNNIKIAFKEQTLRNKRFSTMTARYGFISKNRQQQIQQYHSRDPVINKQGKLELKVETGKYIRPSSYNCVIENQKNQERCRLLLTEEVEIIVMGGFSPLMAFSLAVSRIDWNQDIQKRRRR